MALKVSFLFRFFPLERKQRLLLGPVLIPLLILTAPVTSYGLKVSYPYLSFSLFEYSAFFPTGNDDRFFDVLSHEVLLGVLHSYEQKGIKKIQRLYRANYVSLEGVYGLGERLRGSSGDALFHKMGGRLSWGRFLFFLMYRLGLELHYGRSVGGAYDFVQMGLSGSFGLTFFSCLNVSTFYVRPLERSARFWGSDILVQLSFLRFNFPLWRINRDDEEGTRER